MAEKLTVPSANKNYSAGNGTANQTVSCKGFNCAKLYQQLMLTRDPLIKAQHFQDCAQESLQRAECAQTSAVRHHHLTLARHYLSMGEAELEEASKLLLRRLRRAKNKGAARTAATRAQDARRLAGDARPTRRWLGSKC